jgi:hypothetical protein
MPVKVVPLQQKTYSPVVVFHAKTAAAFERSWTQTLNTLTLNEQVAVLPEASVAVQVTVVVPTGKVEPEGGTQATVTPGQLSAAVGGGKVTTEPLVAGQVGAVTATTLVGQVIEGGCVSLTVMVNEQFDVRAISTDLARISLLPPIAPTSVAEPSLRLIV